MSMHRFIHCEDGSFLLVANITRIFITEDTITKTSEIKASTLGPAMPFTLGRYDGRLNATLALAEIITALETDD